MNDLTSCPFPGSMSLPREGLPRDHQPLRRRRPRRELLVPGDDRAREDRVRAHGESDLRVLRRSRGRAGTGGGQQQVEETSPATAAVPTVSTAVPADLPQRGGGVPVRLGRVQRPRGEEGPAGARPGPDAEAPPAHQRQARQDGAAPEHGSRLRYLP